MESVTKQQITFNTSHLYPVGTTFTKRGKAKKQAEVIGYRVTHDTDTQETKVWYRIQTVLMGQVIKSDVPPPTVAMGNPIPPGSCK